MRSVCTALHVRAPVFCSGARPGGVIFSSSRNASPPNRAPPPPRPPPPRSSLLYCYVASLSRDNVGGFVATGSVRAAAAARVTPRPRPRLAFLRPTRTICGPVSHTTGPDRPPHAQPLRPHDGRTHAVRGTQSFVLPRSLSDAVRFRNVRRTKSPRHCVGAPVFEDFSWLFLGTSGVRFTRRSKSFQCPLRYTDVQHRRCAGQLSRYSLRQCYIQGADRGVPNVYFPPSLPPEQ